MKDRATKLQDLLAEQLAQSYADAAEADCFFSPIGKRRFPNTLEGDRAKRDAGGLCERGLAVYFDGPGLPEPGCEELFDLIQRVALSYGIDFTDKDKWAAAGAEKLQVLTLCLIRDHYKDHYILVPDNAWPSHKKRRLARHVDFLRKRDELTSNWEAFTALCKDKHSDFHGTSIDTLKRYYHQGKRLLGQSRPCGRPRKLITKGHK